jgi:hypothetical protein
MKKYFSFLFLVLMCLLFHANESQAGFCIGICIGGGGDIPNGIFYSNSSDQHYESRINSTASNEAPFHPFDSDTGPERLLFMNASDQLIGGATQIDVKHNVFITARHVLAGHNRIKVYRDIGETEKILKLVSIDDFHIIQLREQSNPNWLDVLILVSKNEDEVPFGLMDLIGEISRPPSTKYKWYSWPYSLFNEQITDGFSSGILFEKLTTGAIPHFWLDASSTNYTSPGSSGTVVWQPTEPDSQSLRPVGVIQCMEHPSAQEQAASNHVPKPRFLSLFHLSRANLNVEIVEASALLNGPPQPQKPNCIPINGRQGGGF